ncbi:UNKNOWN [Stylonychia lemnae]|uniref:Uncharacterized protein n=1 Tax=Stylonychia lemnae TaxID=5949 RepID=A0A078A8H7_STYLE|nr:UNKNOWN [Stylonychia lemnae]|eukprot:CDW78565.1 UNKNOWN [Stylonychia lemnae]
MRDQAAIGRVMSFNRKQGLKHFKDLPHNSRLIDNTIGSCIEIAGTTVETKSGSDTPQANGGKKNELIQQYEYNQYISQDIENEKKLIQVSKENKDKPIKIGFAGASFFVLLGFYLFFYKYFDCSSEFKGGPEVYIKDQCFKSKYAFYENKVMENDDISSICQKIFSDVYNSFDNICESKLMRLMRLALYSKLIALTFSETDLYIGYRTFYKKYVIFISEALEYTIYDLITFAIYLLIFF